MSLFWQFTASNQKNKNKPLKPSGYFMYQRVQHSKVLRSDQTVYLSVMYVSQNKQRLFPYTALTGTFLLPRRSVFIARYGLDL